MAIKQYFSRLFSSLENSKTPAPKREIRAPQELPPSGEKGSDAAPRFNTGRRTWPALVMAAVVTLSFLTFPPSPTDIGTNGDVSWGAVLSHAHEHGLQFGTDLVYTYGPLGFLIQGYFSAQDATMRMLADVLICFTAAAGLCLVAWRLRVWWRVLLLGCFVFTAANLEGRTDLVLDVSFLCWGLLCFVESGRRLTVYGCIFAALSAFAGLAKGSFLFLGCSCLILLASHLFVRGRLLLAAGILAEYVALFCLGWAAAGQNLRHIPEFLAKALLVVEAYNEALGWEGLSAVRRSGLVLTLINFALIALATVRAFRNGEKHAGWQRILLFAWVSVLTFSVWKHSFLREDFRHPAFLMGFSPVLALGLGILSTSRSMADPRAPEPPRTWRPLALAQHLATSLAMLGCFYSLLLLQWLYFAPPVHSLQMPFGAALRNLRTLVNPAVFKARMNAATDACRAEAQLPELARLAGKQTIDCFGFKQVYLLFNNMNYRPRPVFQSFVACDAKLMALNEEFYLSKEAPELALFSLAPVDRKLAPLEDARALRALLSNYRPVAAEKDFLLLQRRTWGRPRTTFLGQGTVRAGEPINLRRYGDHDLWMEIQMRPTWTGRLRQFLYRAPTVRLAAYREPGGKLLLRRRAPPPMLAAGFLVSPLLSTTSDVLELYKGTNITRPAACSVELAPGTAFYWQSEIDYRVYRVDNQLGRCLPPDWGTK